MRRILIDRHRADRAQKRGGEGRRVPLDAIEVPPETRSLDIEALGLALDAFRAIDPRGHEVVQLRYFLGFTVEETAEALDLSPRTVKSDWAAARVWLKRRLERIDERRAGDGGDA
jgi:RNA polymerase sigma factor (TIGR02999 family)